MRATIAYYNATRNAHFLTQFAVGIVSKRPFPTVMVYVGEGKSNKAQHPITGGPCHLIVIFYRLIANI